MADAPVKQVVAAEGCTGATVTAANSQAAALGAAAASAIAAAFSANPSPLGTRHPAPGGAKVAGASRCAAVAVQPPAQPPPRPQPKLQPPTPLCAGVVEQAPPALQRAGAAPTQAPPAPLCVGAANPAPQCATAGYLPRCVPAQLAPQCMAAVPSMAFCPSQYPLQLGPGGYMGGAPGMGVPAGGVPRGGAMPLGHPCCGHPMAGGQVAGGQVAGGQGAAYPSAQYPVGMQIGVGQTGAGQAQGAATQAYTSHARGCAADSAMRDGHAANQRGDYAAARSFFLAAGRMSGKAALPTVPVGGPAASLGLSLVAKYANHDASGGLVLDKRVVVVRVTAKDAAGSPAQPVGVRLLLEYEDVTCVRLLLEYEDGSPLLPEAAASALVGTCQTVVHKGGPADLRLRLTAMSSSHSRRRFRFALLGQPAPAEGAGSAPLLRATSEPFAMVHHNGFSSAGGSDSQQRALAAKGRAGGRAFAQQYRQATPTHRLAPHAITNHASCAEGGARLTKSAIRLCDRLAALVAQQLAQRSLLAAQRRAAQSRGAGAAAEGAQLAPSDKLAAACEAARRLETSGLGSRLGEPPSALGKRPTPEGGLERGHEGEPSLPAARDVVAAIKQPGNFDFLYHAGVLRKHEAPPSLAPPSLAPPAGPSALPGPSAANAPPPQQQKEVAHLLQQVGASALPSLPQQPQQLAQLLQQVGTPHSAAVQT
ncbi:hypothetical protein EMIHUDRAFT_112294 [Emiliania huxleyi CCMP1516]|uniref:CUB domain-containing protein n=2 Tax=Emiliania huxleyi TaxID=2903 RepID=A0A0D3KA04_EMIH1|nr:hypothetical protein EMIHUDRAFT_112294 [Emiliania huxleyi CCMP1516]EOD32589.1 hypothetical protein EMIHUDRAFT_112294 [Emiliania huxleyi CCMP1516]|eukprot:XP_005785018.1 hypothetical protein EMIHUDRAFT_112294 [Emiliania huxleyi CCMP1516]